MIKIMMFFLVMILIIAFVAAEANNSTTGGSGRVGLTITEPPNKPENNLKPLASPIQKETNQPASNLEGKSQNSEQQLLTPVRIFPIALIALLITTYFLVDKKRRSFSSTQFVDDKVSSRPSGTSDLNKS